MPIPVSLTLFKGFEGTATAATLPTIGAGAAMTGSGFGLGASSAAGGGVFAGGVALKAAAVVTAASVAGGVGVVGATEVEPKGKGKGNSPVVSERPGQRLGQVAPRGVLVPGRGIARGKADAPGQTKTPDARVPGRSTEKRATTPPRRGVDAKANARGQKDRQTVPVQGRENAQTRGEKLGTTKAPVRAQSDRGDKTNRTR